MANLNSWILIHRVDVGEIENEITIIVDQKKGNIEVYSPPHTNFFKIRFQSN